MPILDSLVEMFTGSSRQNSPVSQIEEQFSPPTITSNAAAASDFAETESEPIITNLDDIDIMKGRESNDKEESNGEDKHACAQYDDNDDVPTTRTTILIDPAASDYFNSKAREQEQEVPLTREGNESATVNEQIQDAEESGNENKNGNDSDSNQDEREGYHSEKSKESHLAQSTVIQQPSLCLDKVTSMDVNSLPPPMDTTTASASNIKKAFPTIQTSKAHDSIKTPPSADAAAAAARLIKHSVPLEYFRVEMRQDHGNGRYLGRFATIGLAQGATGIFEQDIRQACFSGGGLVNGRYFLFVNERGERVSDQLLQALAETYQDSTEDETNKAVIKESTPTDKQERSEVEPATTSEQSRAEPGVDGGKQVATSVLDSDRVQRASPQHNQVDDCTESVFVVGGEKNPSARASPAAEEEAMSRMEIDMVVDEAKQKAAATAVADRDATCPIKSRNDVVTESGKKRVRDESDAAIGAVEQILVETAAKQQESLPSSDAPQNASIEGGPEPPFTFDVSTLLPVKKSYKYRLKPPKIIELLDKGTNHVMVCFRGIAPAHRALGLERDTVTMACLNYGTPSQPDLDGYILRYAADQDGDLVAYEYGVHKEDFVPIDETHQARLARWTSVVKQERSRDTLPTASKRRKKTPAPEPRKSKVKKNPPKSSKKEENKKTSESSPKASSSAATKAKSAGLTSFRGVGTEGELIRLTDVSVPTTVTNDTDTSMICLICQEKNAEVVFEPCHHCVLCSSCSKESCRTFCPSCRSTITDRMNAKFIRVIRPRVYSAYSFM